MCGILFEHNVRIEKERFLISLRSMSHRGPDAVSGYYAVSGGQLGHNRLKILDLDDRSNQPFFSTDKRYACILNGEIYNYREIARKYSIEQRTTSDTEVLVELFVRLGPAMMDELNGMFAFVIFDTTTGKFFIARDRLGIKPLYIHQSGENIVVASEIASIYELLDDVNFDPIGVRQYLKLRTFFNGRTLYKEIKMFPAGHYMFEGKMTRYWSLPKGYQTAPGDDELRELLVSSVEKRCLSDVPVGSYLSGGLDSTIVAGLAAKPHTWTVGFSDCNEFEWAQLAAEAFNSRHSQVLIDREEFVSLAKSMITKRREPLSVPNEVLLYKMTQAVKEENTVILSGEGADELFFGYDRIFRWAKDNTFDIREFTRRYAYGSADDIEIVEDAVAPFMHYGTAIDIVAAFFQVSHLHGLLRRLDNSTMLCSVEARVPFVDHRLVERMAGVDAEYRMADGVVKAPLKRVFAAVVPQPIIERPKVGFPVPLASIPFGINAGEQPMDTWLAFNLQQLGININECLENTKYELAT